MRIPRLFLQAVIKCCTSKTEIQHYELSTTARFPHLPPIQVKDNYPLLPEQRESMPWGAIKSPALAPTAFPFTANPPLHVGGVLRRCYVCVYVYMISPSKRILVGVVSEGGGRRHHVAGPVECMSVRPRFQPVITLARTPACRSWPGQGMSGMPDCWQRLSWRRHPSFLSLWI
ncbi:hypothetical protein CEXT_36021 [Caerostris extrusa]|uniref:Uncharacterized protein n=1 Tax=Caerostris extrusa TaxID=172846 RepID=A0AAV4MDZ0_CAEEX|nr:hypothetical protein CEXT_36021 [Caerostris extrusa]